MFRKKYDETSQFHSWLLYSKKFLFLNTDIKKTKNESKELKSKQNVVQSPERSPTYKH